MISEIIASDHIGIEYTNNIDTVRSMKVCIRAYTFMYRRMALRWWKIDACKYNLVWFLIRIRCSLSLLPVCDRLLLRWGKGNIVSRWQLNFLTYEERSFRLQITRLNATCMYSIFAGCVSSTRFWITGNKFVLLFMNKSWFVSWSLRQRLGGCSYWKYDGATMNSFPDEVGVPQKLMCFYFYYFF